MKPTKKKTLKVIDETAPVTKKQYRYLEKENGKKATGRPTELTEELLEKARGYLATCHATPIELPTGAIKYVDVILPKVVDLALLIGVNKKTIYEWCKGTSKIAQQFGDIVNEVNAAQEKMLIDKGLSGLFPPKTTGMLLSKHGYSEKTEVTGDTTVTHKIDISKMLDKAYGDDKEE